MSYTGLKARRGHAAEFHRLDANIRDTTTDLGHFVIQGLHEKGLDSIRKDLARLHEEIKLVSLPGTK